MESIGHMNLWIILMVIGRVSAVSYNQPQFCPNASWNPNATTFANISSVGATPFKVFVNTNNTVYVANQQNSQVVVWSAGSLTPIRTISGLHIPWSLFVTGSGDIYVDNPATSSGQVDKLALNSTSGIPVMYTCQYCFDLFVDIDNTLYCSMDSRHQVVTKSLNTNSNTVTIVAGTGSVGSTSNTLNYPNGIFVTVNLDLYVADSFNNRIQLFPSGQLNAITVAGTGSLNTTIALSHPNAVTLDTDGYLFIADSWSNRIVGSGPSGFRCIVGCSGVSGSESYQLYHPSTLSFDSYGNIFVSDYNNNRIQKFFLMTNSCDEITTTTQSPITTAINNIQFSTNTIYSNYVTASPSNEIVSYNQPKLNAFASWSANAVTFATTNIIGAQPFGLFVNTNNTVYVADRTNNRILVWDNGSINPTRTLADNLLYPTSIFVSASGDIYVDNGNTYGRLDRFATSGNSSVPAMYTDGQCLGIFVDITNNLYCSLRDFDKVIRKSLNSISNVTTIVAGTGCSGSISNMLTLPHGIFVDTNFDLYVADAGNNRIQLFRAEELDAITVAGDGSLNTTITLNCPTGVVLDADKYLFITDRCNNRIVGSGPNGFRCVVGCSGSASDQLSAPMSLSFDSYGNIFVTEWSNSRIQKFILLNNTLAPSYNQPKLSPNASWNPNATTFANSSIIGVNPTGIFINTNNTIYVADRTNNRIQIWINDSLMPIKTISGNLVSPASVFVTTTGDTYIDNAAVNGRVDKWSLNTNTSIPVMYVNSTCSGLFVDVSDTLYCSMLNLHFVVKKWLNDNMTTSAITAGTGIAGNTTYMLNAPHGIFADTNFDLYVADAANHRIQLFQLGQLSGITVAGNGSLNFTIALNFPTAVILDADKYLFIADGWNNRIVGSGPYGFRCLVGCFGVNGLASDQLSSPSALSFDSYGNMYITDWGNNRTQKFLMFENSSDQTTVVPATTQIRKGQSTSVNPTTVMMTTSKAPIGNHQCFPPKVTLIPGTSTLSAPLQFRRNQDFSISSYIELNCNISLSTVTQWTMRNCTSTYSSSLLFGQSITTTLSELYVPARTLAYGIYELKLTVTMNVSPNLTSSASVYVQIKPSDIIANLVQSGTSMITSGRQQDLKLDPGTFSIDPDGYVFNASDWSYKYYCRIYVSFNFPNVNGSLLTIDNPTTDPQNPSCLSNSSNNGTVLQFIGVGLSSRSSVLIRAGSLQSNRTYQFMTRLQNLRNNLSQATSYILVRVEDTSSPTITIGCAISAMCIANMEFQLVNPTTQVALFALCVGNCTNIQSITWNIYQGSTNSSTNTTEWILSNQTITHQNVWFFGGDTSHFTVTNQLFLSNSQISLWQFEVVYSFIYGKSFSALNFLINQPPSNGSCSIDPLNGTTSTVFEILCTDWFDENGIKDYSIYSWTTNPSTQSIVAFSPVSTFQVRLPVGNDQTSLLHLILYIRDTYECVAEFNMTSIRIVPDTAGINDLVSILQSSSANTATNNPIVQLLASGNQNTVSQVIGSLSQQFNKKNSENMNSAVASGVPAASISISPLGSKRTPPPPHSAPLNVSALIEFNKELNSQANIRDYLMTFTTSLAITTANSIKLQASSLAQLTQATNQLTRATLIIASEKCCQLSLALQSMSIKIAYEDVQTAATDLTQCATNALSAINGPLQQRTNVLDLDLSRSTTLPADYDTDIESEWSNPNLFADGNDFSYNAMEKGRNQYYQKQLADQITSQTNEILSSLSSALNIHLNIGQNSIINTLNVFMSLETVSADTLSNKNIQQVGSAQIQLPSKFSSNLDQKSTLSLRSTVEPLAPLGNSKSQSTNTNLSTSISLSLFDQYGKEIPIETNPEHPIEIIIPRDPNLAIPPLILQNTIVATPHQQLFSLQYINITSTINISVHWEIHPLNTSLAYLFIYKFDSAPQLNSSVNLLDGWTLLCPSNLTNDSLYKYYIDNQKTSGHQSVIFGLRELNSTEMINFCGNISPTNPPITDQRFNFTSNYQLRIYTSGCYYLDQNNQWKSDGLVVGPLTNFDQTQCFSTHLTKFTGGFRVLPAPVNWNYVFANADFMKNKTVYLTVICVSVIYIILVIYSRFKDRKDLEKLGVTPLPDNHQSDQYFYQILVFTGQRKDSGTKSKVHFVIHGNDDETHVRTLADPHRPILQRGGIGAFIMAVPKSLGLLNCIRIWHDNSGHGSSSWFLTYIIIRDLQTMEKFHFISQRWFAVEKDDGKIKRVLPVAGEMEKREFSYILSKRAYHSVSDGHLWFSIFSRPASNQFTRVQRCTCCFVLFFISMFLNIMYYDLSNEAKTHNSTNTVGLSLGPVYLSSQQIIVGIIVELFALIPSLLLVQLFRRLRQKPISPLREVLYKIRSSAALRDDLDQKKNKPKSARTFPWWWIFIAYGLCVILVSLSIIFIIARGIEFGDLKTQQWLASILTGFFSSILLTQPLKILCLAIFFVFFCRKSNDDQEAKELLDEGQLDLSNDEEYLHSLREQSIFTCRPPVRADRLNEAEVACARHQRFQEIHMWSILREIFTYVSFFAILCLVTYSTSRTNSFLQVNHLRSYFLNPDYTGISTINEYWKWLEGSFVGNIRAQQWYNGEAPRNLSGFINDKSNRLIGWPMMRQLRIKSDFCSYQELRSNCLKDYSLSDEEKDSFSPGWINQTTEEDGSSILRAFQYQSSDILGTYVYIGDHGSYSGNGYVYEFRGRLSKIRNNLFQLHQLEWIDNHTRAVIIQLSLYNANVQLFTSVTLLMEFLSTGRVFPTARFEPFIFATFTSKFQLICTIIYMMMVIYFMFVEIQSLIHSKSSYFHRCQSYISLSIIICSWTSVGIYVWRYKEYQRISSLFRQTNGYVYINLQMVSYVNDILTYLYGICCFFGTIQFLNLCRFNQRLLLFSQTLQNAGKELLSFSMMFSIIFFAFLCLFYFLFNADLQSCSSLFQTARMLFEMILMNFDAHQLIDAAAFLGPFCFSLCILLVVFVCMSMFLSIINQNFRRARKNLNRRDDKKIFSFMMDKFLRWTGWRKPTAEEIHEEQDARMRSQYFDPIERFPERIDQLLDVINRLYMMQRVERIRIEETAV